MWNGGGRVLGTFKQPKLLIELAAFAILRNKLAYKEHLPSHLTAMLDNAGRCSKCKKPFVGEPDKVIMHFDLATLTENGLERQLVSGSTVPIQHRLCSDACKAALCH
jgi:hypothetical protein